MARLERAARLVVVLHGGGTQRSPRERDGGAKGKGKKARGGKRQREKGGKVIAHVCEHTAKAHRGARFAHAPSAGGRGCPPIPRQGREAPPGFSLRRAGVSCVWAVRRSAGGRRRRRARRGRQRPRFGPSWPSRPSSSVYLPLSLSFAFSLAPSLSLSLSSSRDHVVHAEYVRPAAAGETKRKTKTKKTASLCCFVSLFFFP